MIERTSAGTERGIERGQALVETLIRRPVKEAVREALEEQGQRTPTGATGQDAQSSPGESRRIGPILILSLLGVAATALYLRRREGDVLDMPPAGEQAGEAGDLTGSVATGPDMGSGRSGEESEAEDTDDEGVEADPEEDATTSS